MKGHDQAAGCVAGCRNRFSAHLAALHNIAAAGLAAAFVAALVACSYSHMEVDNFAREENELEEAVDPALTQHSWVLK